MSRAEYKAWKESQQAKGVTEGLNPQEYKRLKDAGVVKTEAPKKAQTPKKVDAAAKVGGAKKGKT